MRIFPNWEKQQIFVHRGCLNPKNWGRKISGPHKTESHRKETLSIFLRRDRKKGQENKFIYESSIGSIYGTYIYLHLP